MNNSLLLNRLWQTNHPKSRKLGILFAASPLKIRSYSCNNALGLIILAGLDGAYWWSREHGGKSSAKEQPAAKETGPESLRVARVEVIHPTRGGIQRTSTQTGSVHPDKTAVRFAKDSGYVKEHSVDFGSKGKQGEGL